MSTSYSSNIERWKNKKTMSSTTTATGYEVTTDPIYGNIVHVGGPSTTIQRMSSIESEDGTSSLPLPPPPPQLSMNYGSPGVINSSEQPFPDPPSAAELLLCPQVEQGPPPRYHPCPGYIEPVRSDEIPSNGIYANYRPVSYASTCDVSASLYEQPIGSSSSLSHNQGSRNSITLSIGSGGGGHRSNASSNNSSNGSSCGGGGVISNNCVQVNYQQVPTSSSANLYANCIGLTPQRQPSSSSSSFNQQQGYGHQQQSIINNNNLTQIRIGSSSSSSSLNCAIGHGVSGYHQQPVTTSKQQLSPKQQQQVYGHQHETRVAPQSHDVSQQVMRPSMSGHHHQQQHLESLKQITKEDEVDQLTDLLVQSMGNSNDPDFCGICYKCKRKIIGEVNGCCAMDRVYHIKCFTCKTCGKQLRGKSFYNVDGKPLCEEDYMNTLEKCCVCIKPILDRILRATGNPYHPDCFTCIVCNKCLDGIPFTVDNVGKIHCIEDFHRKFAPRCYVCHEPILPEPGQHETVRVVALDRSYHVNCYRCEDCHIKLTSSDEGRGCYPLDNHILCKDCNATRVNQLTS